MNALGRLFDIVPGVVNVDAATAGATGKKVSLRNAGGVTVEVTLGAAASGTESIVLTVKQHIGTGGSSANLAVVDKYWIKAASTLTGAETWTKITQAASQTVTIADTQGAITGVAQKQVKVMFEVDAAQLAAGYTHFSVDVGDPGSVSRIVALDYILRDLKVGRTPENLINPQT